MLFLEEKTLIMKLIGHWSSLSKVIHWCNVHWGKAYSFKTLVNGFLLVICLAKEDKEWILKGGPYLIDGKGIYLRDWTPKFNPLKELVKEIPVWIRLHNFPFEYRDKET